MQKKKFVCLLGSLAVAVLANLAVAQNGAPQTSKSLIEQPLQSRPDQFGEILKHVQKYEYDRIGMSFLANLGRVIYEYQKARPRQYLSNLEKFTVEYPKLPQEPQITFQVIVPPGTPIDAKVFIAGNHPLLGNWDPGKVMLNQQKDSLWTIALRFPKGLGLEFKITRGAWNMQAIYQEGVIPGNTQLLVNADTTITIRPKTWSDVAFKSGGGITGTVKYHRGLKHPKLRYPRDLIVWLPPSYEKDTRKRYPVLYMHDGQNIIDPSTSFLGADWRVDEVADSLIRGQKMEEIIVVGIYNTPDRSPEYSDTELGHAYADFVIHQLKPMIDSTYRTKPEAKNTAVMGSSMGGLISFLLVWWHPEVFSKAGCLSSAFLVDDNKILKEVRAYTGPRKPIRVYLDGGSEGLEARLKPGYDEMVALLLEKGYVKGVDLEYFYDEGAEHNERTWAKRIWRVLGFMFGR